MLVLGIVNNDVSGACLIENNNILAAVHEERFTRKKNDSSWPLNSIEFVLNSQNKTLDDIDYVTYGWCAGFSPQQHLDLYVDRITNAPQEQHSFIKKRISDEINNDKAKKIEFRRFVEEANLSDKVLYIDHHRSHGFGAYLCSPFENALVITCDGRGDFQSLTICEATPDSYNVLHRETSIDSLGYFYGRITKLLGYKPNQHEGKVTGLAAFGDPNKYLFLMEQMINIEDGKLRANCGEYFSPSYNEYSTELLNVLKEARPEDIAAAAQSHLENLIVKIVSKYVNPSLPTNVCLSGGVFGNVKLNQRIREINNVANIYVLPCMGDGGHPLSSAVVGMYDTSKIRTKTPSMFLGPNFSDEEIIELIENTYPDISFHNTNNIIDEVICELSNNQVVGLFRGKMEFAPRALCNRSIIYHTKDKTMNDWLNKRFDRTEFMPFAPVTPENLAEKCFINWSESDISAKFMTVTYDCTELMKSKCPAVVHIDGTARPQIIIQNKDNFTYDLINKWYELTGEPSLVNTSFNKHEEPIVCSPADALDALRSGIIDVVCFNDRIICKKAS